MSAVATVLTLWTLAGVVSLLWFWPTAIASPYRRVWHRRVDCTLAFLLGPIGLLLNGWISWGQWRGGR